MQPYFIYIPINLIVFNVAMDMESSQIIIYKCIKIE